MYRDELYAAQCRKRQIERSERSARALPRVLVKIYAYRQARVWAGAVGLLGFASLLGDIFVGSRHLTGLLLGSWVLGLCAFCLAGLLAGPWLRRAVRRASRSSGDLFADLSRLDRGGALHHACQRIHRLEALSLALPLSALALLAPLTVHFFVGTWLLHATPAAFGGWILVSLVLVGHAHGTLVVFALRHVVQLRRELDRRRPVLGGSRGAMALLWTIAASAVPGAVLLFIPPIIVALTGALFVPWMFHWAAQRALVERLALRVHGLDDRRGRS